MGDSSETNEDVIVEKFAQLSPEAKEFLSKMDSEDVHLLKDGLSLIKSLRTVGRFMKWLILGTLGIFFGTVMLWESIIKFLRLWKGLGT
jgi:hypothetical protein